MGAEEVVQSATCLQHKHEAWAPFIAHMQKPRAAVSEPVSLVLQRQPYEEPWSLKVCLYRQIGEHPKMRDHVSKTKV